MQETDTIAQSILRGQMTAGQPLRRYLLHRVWDPVLEACGRLSNVCSSPSPRPMHDHQQNGSAVSDGESALGHLEDIRAALDEISAAGLQAAQVSSSIADSTISKHPLLTGQ